MFPTRSAVLLAAALLPAACAQAPADPVARAEYNRTNDPAEPTNRRVFAANQYVDRNVLKPVATAYAENVPTRVRRSIGNFGSNLKQPGVLVNDLLQGNVRRAWNTAQRFAVNTTIGGAGLFDAATDWGLPAHEADFGQTLGVWGVGPGPAIQIPLLGPSNLRDVAGLGGGMLTNPLNLVTGGVMQAVSTAGTATGVVDGRARLLATTDDLERNSLDYYATLRSVSAQRRAALIQEGREGKVAPPSDPAAPAATVVPAATAAASPLATLATVR